MADSVLQDRVKHTLGSELIYGTANYYYWAVSADHSELSVHSFLPQRHCCNQYISYQLHIR